MFIQKEKIPIIILCGGMGTRLKEETEFKPKPMVFIGEKPILWHIMKIYAHYGYRDFILALGYKGDYIKDYFIKQKYYASDFTLNTGQGDFLGINVNDELKKDNFNITFSDTGLETPHGERVLKLKKYINNDLFMVTYGDGVADINIDKLVEFHKNKGVIATITGVNPVSRWGLLNLDKNDLIINYAQKPTLHGYVNGGFMVFNRKFFDFLKPGNMIEDTFPELASQNQLAVYKHQGFWYGMDTYREYLILNKLWRENPKWKIWKN